MISQNSDVIGWCKVASKIWSWNDKTITISPHISNSWGPEDNHSCHFMISLWKQYRSTFTGSAVYRRRIIIITLRFPNILVHLKNSSISAEVVKVLRYTVSIASANKRVAWFYFGLSEVQLFEIEIPILVSAADSKYRSAGSYREKHMIRLVVLVPAR